MPNADFKDNSMFLDIGPDIVKAPDPKDVRIRDPEEYLKRLTELQTPRERLIEFAKSLFVFDMDEATHESTWIRRSFLLSFFCGGIVGGIIKNIGYHEEYVRRNNYSVFSNRHVANRHLVDNYIYSTVTKGTKCALGSGLLVSSAFIVSLGSVNYRNKLYLPDWLVGFATIGAVSRCWLGTRGVLAGGALGSLGGLLGFGFAKSLEVIYGMSAPEFRYLYHQDYLRRQEAKLERARKARMIHEMQEGKTTWN